MSWWSWLLLGAFGPYALMFVVILDWTIAGMVRKMRYGLGAYLDKRTPAFVVGQRKSGQYFIITKLAGTNKCKTALENRLPDVVELLNAFYQDACDWCGEDGHAVEMCPQSPERHPVTGEL